MGQQDECPRSRTSREEARKTAPSAEQWADDERGSGGGQPVHHRSQPERGTTPLRRDRGPREREQDREREAVRDPEEYRGEEQERDAGGGRNERDRDRADRESAPKHAQLPDPCGEASG